MSVFFFFFFFSSRRRHTRSLCDWSSDVCSSDLATREQRRSRPFWQPSGQGLDEPRVGALNEARVGLLQPTPEVSSEDDQTTGVQRAQSADPTQPIQTTGREHKGVLVEPWLQPGLILYNEKRRQDQRANREPPHSATPNGPYAGDKRHEEAEEYVISRVRQGRDRVPQGRQRIVARRDPEVRGEEQARDQTGHKHKPQPDEAVLRPPLRLVWVAQTNPFVRTTLLDRHFLVRSGYSSSPHAQQG